MSGTTRNFQRLLQLVRCSLFGKEVDASLFEEMSGEDWLQLIEYSKTQGVSAIAFQAFNNTEACNVHPGMRELGTWYGQTEYVKEKFGERKQLARKLARFYKKRGVDMFLMKGLALAYLYPIPETREFGDLDIYTFDKHDEANKLISDKGAEIEYEEKHDEFTIGGILIEHHHTFLRNNGKAAGILNRYLASIVSKDSCECSEDGWLMPTLDFNAVFLLRHMTAHLTYEGLPLKNILDYGLFLMKEGDKVDWTKAHGIIKESGMTTAYDTIVAVCERVLDEDLSRYHIGKADPELVEKVLNEIVDVALHQETNLPLFPRIYRKTLRIFSCRWLYSSGLLPDSFWREFIMRSLRDHIVKPNKI